MADVLFSWMYGDPAEHLDRLREMKTKVEKAQKQQNERTRKRKARRIKQLLKAALNRKSKGQSHG